MQAVILAGGMGTRLRSVLSDRPKPMADVGDQPFLELQVGYLKQSGIADFVFCVGYLHKHIQDYFGDGKRWGVSIKYSVEQDLLGTGGAIKHAENHINGAFLSLNGDSFKEIDVRNVIRFHEQKKAIDPLTLGTIVLTAVTDARDFGSVSIDEHNRILNFAEKSSKHGIGEKLISAGIYVLESAFLARIPAKRAVSLEREIFPAVLAEGCHLFGYEADGFFADIGTPLGYLRFQDYIKGRQS